MTNFTKSILTVSIAVLMTACASNKGSFELHDVEIKPTATQNQSQKTWQDVQTTPRNDEQLTNLTEPSMGASMELVVRNSHAKSTETVAAPSPESLKLSTSSDTFEKVLDRRLRDLQRKPNGSSNSENYQNSFEHPDWYGSRDRRYMQFVKSGWVADLQPKIVFGKDGANEMRNGMNGFVFYQGKDPAKFFPNQTVTYKGSWDFMTDAKQGRATPDDYPKDYKKGAGENFSAFSFHESFGDDLTWRNEKKAGNVYDAGHQSVFTVNFNDKTMTGDFYRNKNKDQKIHRYTMSAKLVGNRFRGSATAVDGNDAYFGKNSATLEGGFFGNNAQELGGKFLTDDNSLFAVFSARQHDGKTHNPTSDVSPAFDAVKLSNKTYSLNQMDTFGNATWLVVDGRVFSLLPQTEAFLSNREYSLGGTRKLLANACCQNLNHVKFGNFVIDDDGYKEENNLFLTGERTPISDMIQSGTYQYNGTWEANVITTRNTRGGTTPTQNNSRAEFTVDFGTKSILGYLYKNDAVKPTILIENGVINGNGFTAKFKTGESGFVLDSGATGDKAELSGDVTGGFYGPKAIELGGYFYSNDRKKDRVVGVFGAKQQVLK